MDVPDKPPSGWLRMIPRVGHPVSLTLITARDEHHRRSGDASQRDGGHRTRHVLHRIQNRGDAILRPRDAVHPHPNLRVRIFRLEREQSRARIHGDVLIDPRAEEDDPLARQRSEDVRRAASSIRHHHRHRLGTRSRHRARGHRGAVHDDARLAMRARASSPSKPSLCVHPFESASTRALACVLALVSERRTAEDRARTGVRTATLAGDVVCGRAARERTRSSGGRVWAVCPNNLVRTTDTMCESTQIHPMKYNASKSDGA